VKTLYGTKNAKIAGRMEK